MSKRIVKSLNFEGEGAHVALVEKGANGQEVLLMKQVASEVVITTSMTTFLHRFFEMWHEDANELAVILGYEPQEWSYSMVGDETNVQLMKSAKEGDSLPKDLHDKILMMSDEFDTLIKAKEEKEIMNEEEKVALQKSIDAAVAAALEKQKTENVDLQKELKESKQAVVNLQKAQDAKEKDELVVVLKGYSFVEDVDAFADVLFKTKDTKSYGLVLDTLEKARVALKESLEKEVGTDEEAQLAKDKKEPTNLTETARLIKERHGNKETE